jgi:hypothetical protein
MHTEAQLQARLDWIRRVERTTTYDEFILLGAYPIELVLNREFNAQGDYVVTNYTVTMCYHDLSLFLTLRVDLEWNKAQLLGMESFYKEAI